jgi:hypothetical protein
MTALATTAIRLAVIWAVSTGIVWVSVRLVGRRLNVLDAASVAFVGSLLSLGVLFIPVVGFFSVLLVWTVLLVLACGLSLWRAAVSSIVVQVLAFIAFHLIG